MTVKIDMRGKSYGRLHVLKEAGRQGSFVTWKCKCDCGSEVIVSGNHLRSGHTKSCGCLAKELKSKRALGKNHPNYKHGGAGTPEYITWWGMMARCYRPDSSSYKYYGAKGIIVCERWHCFEHFLKDMGRRPEGLTLDRENQNGDYEPSNCRWSTLETQSGNRSSTIQITFKGKTQCMAVWARELGINYGTLRKRFKLGWPIEKAFKVN